MRRIFFITSIILLCASLSLEAQITMKYLYGTPQSGAQIQMDKYGRIAFQTDAYGHGIVENWARYDSTAFDSVFVDTNQVVLPYWGDIGPVLEFKMIFEPSPPGDSIPVVYDLTTRWDGRDTILYASPTALVDTLYHNMDVIFAADSTNLSIPDSNDHYLLYLKYVRHR